MTKRDEKNLKLIKVFKKLLNDSDLLELVCETIDTRPVRSGRRNPQPKGEVKKITKPEEEFKTFINEVVKFPGSPKTKEELLEDRLREVEKQLAILNFKKVA